jgi:hypothetical protein
MLSGDLFSGRFDSNYSTYCIVRIYLFGISWVLQRHYYSDVIMVCLFHGEYFLGRGRGITVNKFFYHVADEIGFHIFFFI